MSPDRFVAPFAVLFGIVFIVTVLFGAQVFGLKIAGPDVPTWNGDCLVKEVGIEDGDIALTIDCQGNPVVITNKVIIVRHVRSPSKAIFCTKFISHVLDDVSYSCRIGDDEAANP